MPLAMLPLGNPLSLLGYIDSVIGIATFLLSKDIPVSITNIRSYFEKKNKEIPEYFDFDDSEEFIKALIIHPDILVVLRDKVKKALKDYKKCLKKARRQQENHACDVRAEREICEILNRILDRNENKLPSEILKNQWISFGCVRI